MEKEEPSSSRDDTAAAQGGPAQGGPLQMLAAAPAPSPAYRQRARTKYRGVTKTSGTHSGVEKYDVQFVFCDGGTKKHPKIYGFATASSASRAFDILTVKRCLEKGRSLDEVVASGQELGVNHPLTDYTSAALLAMLHSSTRDDIIYGLKVAAKRGMALSPDTLLNDLNSAIEIAATDAMERSRKAAPRQSYQPTARVGDQRKRRAPSAAGGAAGSSRRRRIEVEAASGDALAMQMHPGDLGGLLAGTTTPEQFSQQMLLQLLTNPGLLPVQHAAAAAAARPAASEPVDPGTADHMTLLYELCAAASRHVAEAACVTDLLRIWQAKNRGDAWEAEAYTLPASYYHPHVEGLLATGSDLQAAMTFCHDLWRRGVLRGLMALYVSNLANVQLAGMLPQAVDGTGAGGAGDSGMSAGGGGDGGEVTAAAMAHSSAILQQRGVMQALLAAAVSMPASAATGGEQQQEQPGEEEAHQQQAMANGQQQHLQSLMQTLQGNLQPHDYKLADASAAAGAYSVSE